MGLREGSFPWTHWHRAPPASASAMASTVRRRRRRIIDVKFGNRLLVYRDSKSNNNEKPH
jgi:hypothetical protein